MPDLENISLSDALNRAIDRIIGGYEEKWLVTGQTDGENMAYPHNMVYDDYRYENTLQLESHLFTEIFACLQGSCALSLGNNILDVYEGQVCIIMPGVQHCELPKRDCAYLAVWMALDFDMAALHLSGKHSRDGIFYTIDGYTSKSPYEYNAYYGNLKKELFEKTGRYIEMVKALVLQILIIASRNVCAVKNERVDNRLWKESLVLQVQGYIDRNYSGSIRLGDISQNVCVSANYLNNIFKSVTGKTIIQYVEDFRTEKAKHLLKTTDLGIGSIALQLGYCDQYYFSKAFKKGTGYSPSQFRK